MQKQNNIFSITLIITGLVLSPAMAETTEDRIVLSQSLKINKTLVSSIAHILHNRGLDEEVAETLASDLLDEEDEMLLAMLIKELEAHKIASQESVLEYLSMAALHKQKLDITSYDQLIGMVAKITHKPVEENARKKLSQIVKQIRTLA